MTNIKGIDVSKWQGNIDWKKVKEDGVIFAMIRASYGKESIDAYFEKNVKAAQAVGIKVGAYHYCYADTVAEAKAEAKHFLNTIKGYKFEYPICLDLEDSKTQGDLSDKLRTDIAITFLEELESAGYFAMIYCNKDWFENKLDDSRLKKYAHWLAQWTSKITYIGDVGIWQYTSDGAVKGISGRVDMNIAFVDYDKTIKENKLNGFKSSSVKVQTKKEAKIYIVKRDDSLSKIAEKYKTTVKKLVADNNIKDKNLIYPGQKIKIM